MRPAARFSLPLKWQLLTAAAHETIDEAVDVQVVHHAIAVNVAIQDVARRIPGAVCCRVREREQQRVDVEIVDAPVAVHVSKASDADE